MNRYLLTTTLLFGAAARMFGGTYFLTDGDASTAYRIDLPSGTLLGSFSTFLRGYPIAVGSTVRLFGRDDTQVGREYTLAGVATGTTYAGGAAYSELLDGTSDGASHNYAVACCGHNAVVRTDLNWQGLTQIFTLPNSGSGIAYDPLNASLWVSQFDNTIREYSLTGTQLFSFSVGYQPSALAYDASSDSFWVYEHSTHNFANFNRAGVTLQTVTVAALPANNAWGGEMAITGSAPGVPEPGAWALAISGLAAIVVARRRRRA